MAQPGRQAPGFGHSASREPADPCSTRSLPGRAGDSHLTPLFTGMSSAANPSAPTVPRQVLFASSSLLLNTHSHAPHHTHSHAPQHSYTHTHMHPTFIHTLTCTSILMHTLTLMYTYTHLTLMHPDTHTHTLTCTPIFIHTLDTHMHPDTHTHTLTCTPILIHTHTP